MKKQNWIRKTVALLVIVALCITTCPMYAISEEAGEEAAAAKPQILYELEDLRERNSKTYLLDNGNRLAYFAAEPIHYENEDGDWEEINNTLALDESRQNYVNQSNSFQVSLPTTLTGENCVTFGDGEHTVSFTRMEKTTALRSSVQTSEEFTTMDAQEVELDALLRTNPEQRESSVTYNKHLSPVSYEYTVKPNGLKEDIILQSCPVEPLSFQYAMVLSELTAELCEDGSVLFKDVQTNEMIYVIPAPFMFDSAASPAESMAIETHLISDEAGRYVLEYIPDHTWLSDIERIYPVTIDPTISEPTTYVLDSYIASTAPNTNSSTGSVLRLDENTIALVKTNVLNYIDAGAVVERASLYYRKWTPTGKTADVRAYEITSSWDYATVTWNTKPTISETVLDCSDMYDEEYAGFDVSEPFRKALAGENTYGIALKSDTYMTLYSSKYNVGYQPYLTVEFKSSAGINSSYPTRTFDMGKAGQLYLNDYTGKLALKRTDMALTGELAPVCISMIYDMYNSFAGAQFAPGSAMNYMQTNYNMPIRESTYDGRNYQYTLYNDNGNIIYFYQTAQTSGDDPIYYYADVEHMGYRLERKTHMGYTLYYYLYDLNDNKYYYDLHGRLKSIQYANNHQSVEITYQSDTSFYIDYVTDGSGRKFKYNYIANPIAASEKVISSICFYGNNDLSSNQIEQIVNYTYDAHGRVLEVSYWFDGESESTRKVYYTYDSQHRLTSVTDIDGRKWNISYTNDSKVSQIQETDGESVIGDTLTIEYQFKKTIFTNSKGRKQIEYFDQEGKLYNVFDENNNLITLDSSKMESGLFPASEARAFVTNLLSNPSFEEGDTGFSVYARSTTAFNFNHNDAHTGNKALKITSTVSDPAYNAVFKQVGTVQNKPLVFSAWVKTEANTSVDLMLSSSGNSKSTGFVGTCGEWKQIWVTNDFSTASSDDSLYIYISVQGVGSVVVDDLQLSKGTTEHGYNAIRNNDFSHGAENWVLSPNVTVDTAQEILQNYYLPAGTSIKASGDLVQNTATQRVYLNDCEGSIYLFGGFAYSSSALPPKNLNTTRAFGMKVTIYHPTDSTLNEERTLSFNPYASSLQYNEASFTLPFDCNYVDIAFVFSGQHGTANFTAANLRKVMDASERAAADESSVEEDVAEVTNSLGQVTSRTHDNGLVEEYVYDDNNLLVSSKATYDGNYLQATNTYSTDSNLLIATNDENMVSQTATYDLNNSRVLTQNGISFTYDTSGRITQLSKGASGGGTLPHTSKTSIVYANNRPSTITKYDYSDTAFSYEMLYDLFGNITQLKAGGNTLVTYGYDSSSHKLTSAHYAGGNGLQFLYNDAGALTDVQESHDTKYRFHYDEVGTLYRIEDLINNTNITYNNKWAELYNSNNRRLFRYTHSDTEAGFTYELNNRTITQDYAVEEADDYSLVTVEDGAYTYSKKTNYDVFGRNVGAEYRNAQTGGAILFTTQLIFKTISSGQTTRLVQSESFNRNDTAAMQREYTYDSMGRVAATKSGGITLQTYSYDSIGQLSEYTVASTGQRIALINMETGNLGSKVIFDSATGNYIKSISYTYDANWMDKLTGYDGKTITYDAAGNLWSYDGKNYRWDMSRFLSTITGNGKNVAYSYDAFGNLVKRTDGGVTTNYYWAGDTLCASESGGDYMYYRYDTDGLPMSVNYGGTEYYYIVNCLHDVIGIIDGNGNVVVTYEYDPFGQILSVAGSMKDTLGLQNPLRYKSYFYDTGSGFYWLRSRFYNPEWGRFISPDSVLDVSGTATANLYKYCNGDPVNNTDPEGNYSWVIQNVQMYGHYTQDYDGYETPVMPVEAFTNYQISGSDYDRREFYDLIDNLVLVYDMVKYSDKGSFTSNLFDMSKAAVDAGSAITEFVATVVVGKVISPKAISVILALFEVHKLYTSIDEKIGMKASLETIQFLICQLELIRDNYELRTSLGTGNFLILSAVYHADAMLYGSTGFEIKGKVTDWFGAWTNPDHSYWFRLNGPSYAFSPIMIAIHQSAGYLKVRSVGIHYSYF